MIMTRDKAFRILRRIEREGVFADAVLGHDPSRDSHFVRTLVLGTLRWQSRLDHIISTLAGRRVQRIDADALILLRLGVLQIQEMNVPAYAAVGETVTTAGRVLPRARGFVNAVLRKAAATDLVSLMPTDDSAASIAVRQGHPEWLVRRWVERYGAVQSERIAAANQQYSYPDLLIHTDRIPVDAAHTMLTDKGVIWRPSTLVEGMVRLEEASTALADEIGEGLFYPMDEGSASVASLLQSAADPILDVAAAPGGKSMYLLSRGKQVLSSDVSVRRTLLMRHLSRRFTVDALRIIVSDATLPAIRGQVPTTLLDAPCSATGTLRKSPEIKWRLREEDLAAFAAVQKQMLEATLDVTGDLCLYATCSLEPEENDEVVDQVLAGRNDFVRSDLSDTAPESLRTWLRDGVLRLTPDAGTDGFTVTAMRRR